MEVTVSRTNERKMYSSSEMDSSSDDEVGFIYDKKGYVNVWVDGSCLRNGQPGAKAGYGVFYDWNHHL